VLGLLTRDMIMMKENKNKNRKVDLSARKKKKETNNATSLLKMFAVL
jgi:hypothetical protein